MKDWVFLSKDGSDEYIERLAKSCGGKITSTDDFIYEDSDKPIVLRGILKHKIMKKCWLYNRDFYFIKKLSLIRQCFIVDGIYLL